jgi:hypothetical protein
METNSDNPLALLPHSQNLTTTLPPGKRHVDDFIPAFVSLMKELGPAYKKLAFVDNGRANENMTPELTSEGFGLLIGHLVPPDMMDNSMQTAGWWAFFIDW